MIDPAKRLAQIAQRQREKTKAKATAQPVDAVALAIPPSDVTPTPNSDWRSALFTTMAASERHQWVREIVADHGSFHIRYSGPPLNQTDQAVWEWLVDAALQIPLGDPVVFMPTACLQAIGRGNSGVDHHGIVDTLARLVTTTIEVTRGGQTDAGSLVSLFEYDATTDAYRVWLNPKWLARWSMG